MIQYLLLFLSFLILSSCSDTCWNGPCMTIPGNTRADLNAQAVAARSMFINANIYLPNCNKKDMHIIDTVPHGSSEDYLWEEIWIVEACGTKWQGIVEFWKDGSVSTGLKEPRFKQIK